MYDNMPIRYRFARRSHALALGVALVVAGCASYRPLPLNDHPRLPADAAAVKVDTARLPFPALAVHKFDPTDGLDMTETATLAVINNPDLRLARDDAGVARAQAFAAGLLPDPQFTLGRDYPRQSSPGLTSAYNVGLGYDLNALVTHAAGASAARAGSRKTDLNLLWQEWQTVAHARLLFSRAVTDARLTDWSNKNRDLLAKRYRQAQAALAAGDTTADAASGALAAWQDAARQASDLKRQRVRTEHKLDALLGLAPEAKLHLVGDETLAAPDAPAARRALKDLASRRPDLLALKAGYAAQDARYRQAILAQFPPLNLALTAARDTGGILTRGFALAVALPVLNGNRGNVRIEDATRRRLHDEYESRVAAARAEVAQLLADQRLIAGQLHTAEQALPALDQAADEARWALDKGNLDGGAFAAIESARIARHVEAINLRQSLTESRIALLDLLGGEFPAARPEASK